MVRALSTLFAALLALSAHAAPISVDFATAPSITSEVGNIRTLRWSVEGVDVEFSGYHLFQTGPLFPAFTDTRTLTTQGFGLYPITVTFLNGVSAQYVEFTNIVSGVYTHETDVIEGMAFDADGLLVSRLSTGSSLHHLEGDRGIRSVLYQNLNSVATSVDGMTLAHFTFEVNATTLPVPEPSTYALMLLGLTVLCVATRRQKRLLQHPK